MLYSKRPNSYICIADPSVPDVLPPSQNAGHDLKRLRSGKREIKQGYSNGPPSALDLWRRRLPDISRGRETSRNAEPWDAAFNSKACTAEMKIGNPPSAGNIGLQS